MTTTTPQMLLVMPDDHGNINAWGLLLNTIFERIDIHTHAPGLGVLVPAAGLNINADLALGTNALTGAKAFDMTPVATSAVTAYSSALFTNSADNNLYFRNSSGTNVQITSGSTINVSVVGGIGGDYASVGALLDYDDATDTYRLRQEVSALVRQFARASTGGVRLFEYKAAGDASVPTQSVLLASPAALGAGYTVTFAGAVPAAQSIVQIGTGGTLVYSNTMVANQHVAVSGTGRFKHGDMVVTIPAAAISTFAAGTTPTISDAAGSITGVQAHLSPVMLPVGARVRTIKWSYNRGGAGTLTLDLRRVKGSNAAANDVSTTTISAGTGVAQTTTAAIDHTIEADYGYWLRVNGDNAANVYYQGEITYDFP